MTSALFFDPKPRQLHSAASTSAARPWFGMKSRSHAGSGSRWLIVGGRNPRDMRQRRGHDAGGAAGALRVADHRLDRRSGEPSACAPNTCRTQRDSTASFSTVDVPWIVDVADLLAAAPGALDRQRHRADDLVAVRRHLHAVIRVAGRAVAVDRRVDRRAARPRAILALEHEHPRALAEHEPVAAASNGRDASAGRSLYAVDTACIREKPKIMPGVTHASVPPDSTTSASPERISAAA